QLQFNQEPEYFKDRINEVKLANCSADKAKKILNYEKKISLDESLAKMIDYIKIKGNKKFKYNYDLEIVNEKTPRTWVEKKF
ncbi:hypothetical protein N9A53_04970, partial [Candidatus Pelagibacter ubique]|nr:hypothetical protein [Candidatus Pelagibacter ubique]